jgi:cobalamin biosynthesis Mg chelatase CobN
MPTQERLDFLDEKRKEVVEYCIMSDVGTHSDAIKILDENPQMLNFEYFDKEENTHRGRNDKYRIIVRSPFIREPSKTDTEVCERVDQVVDMLKEFYGPLGIHVFVSRTVPSSCKGDRQKNVEYDFKTFLNTPPPPGYDKMVARALQTIRQSRFDSRSGRPTHDDLESSGRARDPLESSSRRPRSRSPKSGGSKSRRTRRRKHNRKTHHKRKHHSRSRSRSHAARKHKKYSRRH